MSPGSWIVFGLIMAAFAAVIVHLIRSRKRGGCPSCGSGCSGCTGCSSVGQCPHISKGSK